jgi:WD40 repeat protein
MSDVFISYSQKLPEPTEGLATDLGARGYAYWYDTRLLPTDVFWRVIMKRITDAKAVIVIWSPPAVDSEWVYGEAKLAHDQKKLVCVRTEDVAPGTVPIPFNGYNVSPLTDRARIFAALEALKVPATANGGFKAPKDDPVLAAPALAAADRASGEIAIAWAEIKDSTDAEDFAVFLKHYGDEHLFFAHMARKRVAKLRGTTVILAPTRPTGAVAQLPPAAKAEIEAVAKDVLLRIEAGMHTAVIRRISLSADGRMLATASYDKTVRLWSLPDGRLVRTLRPSIGPGDDGKVYAVALAPDGRWVAAAGYDATWTASNQMHVTIFDAVTGAAIARLGPLPNAIDDLEVSPRGDRLAAGIKRGNGTRIWETKTWRQVTEDRDYGGDVYGLSFAPDGCLAATSLDGHIRLYGADGRLAKKAKAPGGSWPYGIAFSPDGARLAVGYQDTTRVDVLSGQTLAHLLSADTSGVDNGNLGRVAWLAAGARLAAAGFHSDASGVRPIFAWSDGGKGKRQTFPGPKDTVMDLVAWNQGLAFGAGDPAFGLLDASGKRVLFRGPPMADLRAKYAEHFLVSADGRRARFGLEPFSGDPWLFDLAAFQLAPSVSAPPDLHPADSQRLSVEGWKETAEPKVDGKALPLEPYEMSRSLAIAPDGQSFVLGTEWFLRRFDKDGKPLWDKPVPGAAWGVNLAREGRLILAAYGDGTIRWHRAADGEELLALFIHVPQDPKADKRWVLWTPEGYYTASPGGEDLIGWHVNRGPDQAADFYPAETFRSTFHKPDLVANALDKADR